MKQRARIYYSAEQKNLMWDRWQKGDSMRFIEVVLWLSMLMFVIAGWSYDGIVTALVGFLIWVVFAVVFFGAILLVADIQKNVEKIASSS